MNYYERHIGDYLKDTAHLSLLEHGVYTRLLDVYYTREGGIPDKEVARLIGARSRDEKEALHAVLDEFFSLVDGLWIQARSEAEIARYKGKREKAAASANARWGKSERNANASPEHDANDMRTHSERNATRAEAGARPQSPVTSHQTPDPDPTEPSAPTVGRRGSRLAPGWEPGETGAAFASSQGMGPEKLSLEVAKFRDYWASQTGQGSSKADWQATWRNWVRKAMEFSSRPGSPGAPINRQEALEQRNRAVGERWAAQQQEEFDHDPT